MRQRLTATLLCVALLVVAGAAEPQSKAARTALDKYTSARAKLDADYQTKLANLNRNLTQDLNTAIKAATRSGDLDEANAIKAMLEQMVGRVQTFQVDAAKDWQPTVTVKKGQRNDITAEGKWSSNVKEGESAIHGPDGGTHQGQPFFYLEGRLGIDVFRIGEEWSGTANSDGTIEMRMHDLVHKDNGNALTVSVRQQ